MIDFVEVAEKSRGVVTDFLSQLPVVLFGIAVFAVFYLAAMGVRRVARLSVMKISHDQAGAAIAGRVVFFIMLLLGVLVSASVAVPSFSFGTLVGTLGIGSVAIGFALKDILENFVAGLYILIARPFTVGDLIEIDGYTGRIKDIGVRAAKLQTFEGEMLIMPCARLFKEEVKVLSQDVNRRFELTMGIDVVADLDEVEKVIYNVIAELPDISLDPPSLVVFEEFGDFAMTMRIYYHINTTENDLRIVRSDLVKAVKRACEAAGVTVPYPTSVVMMRRLDSTTPEIGAGS